jgi:peptidoglycan/LPS O-acetylase OafA/YrhL
MIPNPNGPEGVARPPRIGYLPTLDGWRAIAIGLVLLEHGRHSISDATSGLSNEFIDAFPDIGLFGVRIFFGISGFLICSRLIDEDTVRGRISLNGFYIRRFFRIFPPLMTVMLVVLGLSALGVIDVPIRQWLAGIFFAANYQKNSVGNSWYVGHLWSLAVEEHFYLLFPGLLAHVGVARGLALAGIAAVVIALWRAIAYKIGVTDWSIDFGYFWYRTDIIADGLLWGCVVAFLYVSPTRDWLRALLRPAIWWPLCLCLVLSIQLQPLVPDWKLMMVLFSLQALVIPFLMVGTVMWADGFAGRFLESRALRWIGRLSYSIYLWQQLFIVDHSSVSAQLQALQWFPANLVATMAFATLSYFALELPMMRLGHRLARPVVAGRKELAELGRPASP